MIAVFSRMMLWQHLTAIAVVLSVAGLVVYDRFAPPIVPIMGRVEPTSGVRPKESLTSVWTIDIKRSGCDGSVARIFVDWTTAQHVIDVTPITVPLMLGPIVIVRDTVLPASMPEGPALYRISMRLRCNPIHAYFPLVVPFPELPFTVLPTRSLP